MPLNIDHEELSALSEDVFSAIDDVLDTTGPGVARLALTSISMLRFLETTITKMTAAELSAMEELRRLQRVEVQAAKDREERINKTIDAAVQTLVVDVAKAVCKFKHGVGEVVRRLEKREEKGEEVDQKLRALREAHEDSLFEEDVDLPGADSLWTHVCFLDVQELMLPDVVLESVSLAPSFSASSFPD
ncbi:hypothetical protein KCU65_g133, partial [Aureobasidium melanogenum]